MDHTVAERTTLKAFANSGALTTLVRHRLNGNRNPEGVVPGFPFAALGCVDISVSDYYQGIKANPWLEFANAFSVTGTKNTEHRHSWSILSPEEREV